MIDPLRFSSWIKENLNSDQDTNVDKIGVYAMSITSFFPMNQSNIQHPWKTKLTTFQELVMFFFFFLVQELVVR